MRSMYCLGIAAILAVDWAALDDITTGNEPDFAGEFVALPVSLPILVVLGRCAMRAGRRQG